ncbi:alkaline phosphatase [Sphingomonas gilva]|uniref:Alkaline phosphatase n=1 Tax=Sphingomonas gilva TaxID=2305907 RepID=A0A396RZZ2_9SPHN|nr:alkaline phosphatase D family protein [Sphingomonas gilva]RHW19311.1 alkaline phosphatase [Sphingomonas gilva]
MQMRPNRRQATATILGSAALLVATRGAAFRAADDPFTLGVASGEPAPGGVVLWTRLAPRPLDPDGGMPQARVPVRWEISEDEGFERARSGTAFAEPDWGHSVHVEVDGLSPGRTYFYRFIAGGAASPTGRTRTAPAIGAAVDRLRIAFASCQHYEAGHYAAYRHMVADDPDLIVFLGDYIYEGNPGRNGVRSHLNPEPTDLAGYRARYATYRSDPLLQAAHQAAPWVTTWDDHEVQDNYTGAQSKFLRDPEAFARRRAAAYQAHYEHMPLRRSARPAGGSMRLYRAIDWGGLAQFQIVDDRQYRDPPPCQPGDPGGKATIGLRPDCPGRHDPRRTMLGAAQMDWLDAQLGRTRARWNFLSQQTLMMPFKRIPPDTPDAPPSVYNLDAWDGFTPTRERIARRWRDARVPNPVVLSGDIHSFVAGDHFDPDDAGRIIASEFVGGSISSGARDKTLKRGASLNPGFHFADNSVRGYGRIDVTPERCEVALRALSDVRDPQSPIGDLARFAVENGRAGVQQG